MSADTDLEKGVQTLWATNSAIANLVPGGLFTESVKGNLTMPYAQAMSRKSRNPEYQAPVIKGDPYLDYRKLTFTLVGVGKAAVGDLLEQIKPLFPQSGFPIPNAEIRRCVPMDGGEEVVEDETASKSGDKVFRGTLMYEIWAVRFVP